MAWIPHSAQINFLDVQGIIYLQLSSAGTISGVTHAHAQHACEESC